MVEVHSFQNLRSIQEQLKDVGVERTTPISTVLAHRLYQDDLRLDAGYYSDKVGLALSVIERFPGEVRKLTDAVEECFVLGRFKRVYASSANEGWPYLSASDSLSFRPTSDRWIAPAHAPAQAKRHFAKPGWILLSASGTVGRPVLVTERLSKFFLTHDLLRIVPSQDVPSGYLYAYISTWVGQALITKEKYGGAIKHLEPHHLYSIPIPLVSEREREEIDGRIQEVYQLREGANKLLDEADALLYSELNLPRFNGDLVEYLPQPAIDSIMPFAPPSLRAFEVKLSEIEGRLDASYHIPLAKSAVEALGHCSYPICPLSSVARVYLPGRFRRVYVSSEYGVPFLQGSHIPFMRPYDLKYLSRRSERDLGQCRVEHLWILITRSGTIGRVSLVSKYIHGWAASEHLIRIIAEDSYNPGYIATFLMSPYGQYQLLSKIYGGVVDELTVEDTGNILIPIPSKGIQDKIGNKVIEAFEMKDAASAIESETIRGLEAMLEGKVVIAGSEAEKQIQPI